MDSSCRKRVILTNQLSIVSVLLLSLVVLIYGITDIAPISMWHLVAISALLPIPFLNLKGHFNITSTYLSWAIPIIIILISVINKTHMEHVYIGAYVIPRLGIISAGIVPMLLINHNKKKSVVFSVLANFVCLLLLEPLNELLGYQYASTAEEQFNYQMFTYVSLVPYAFIIWGTYFLQRITRRYELRAEMSAQSLAQKNDILSDQKEEIEQQNINLQEANLSIRSKSQKLTDSMVSAQRVQNAIFSKTEALHQHFQNYFLLNRPKDFVSGDFHWVAEKGNKIFFAVGDCTGHGVPGALMSILGTTALNEALIEGLCRPADILNSLREKVKHELCVDGRSAVVCEGMDMALCVYDTAEYTLEFAGANNSAIIISNGEMQEIKPTRNPIGSYHREVPFQNHEIKLSGGEKIYLYSDGYHDQFGGEHGFKFGSKKFKRLLLQTCKQGLKQQYKSIASELNTWQGKYEQIDDILVMGVEIPIINQEKTTQNKASIQVHA